MTYVGIWSLRGVDELLPREDWTQKLARSAATGQPLRIVGAGSDGAGHPHRPHVVLSKMRQLQDLGPPGDFSDRRLHHADR